MSLCVIAGQREVGKSTLSLFYTRRRDPDTKDFYARTRIVFDPRGLIDPTDRETEIIYGLLDEIKDAADFDALDRVLEDGGELIVRPDDYVRRCFDNIMRTVKTWRKLHPGQSIAVLIDEGLLVEEELERKEGAFNWLVRYCGRSQTEIFITVHCMKDIPPKLRRIVDRWCLFRAEDPTDFQDIRDRCGDDTLADVRALKPYQFVKWEAGKRLIYRDPSAWYVSLSPRVDEGAKKPDDLHGALPTSRFPLLGN